MSVKKFGTYPDGKRTSRFCVFVREEKDSSRERMREAKYFLSGSTNRNTCSAYRLVPKVKTCISKRSCAFSKNSASPGRSRVNIRGLPDDPVAPSSKSSTPQDRFQTSATSDVVVWSTVLSRSTTSASFRAPSSRFSSTSLATVAMCFLDMRSWVDSFPQPTAAIICTQPRVSLGLTMCVHDNSREFKCWRDSGV